VFIRSIALFLAAAFVAGCSSSTPATKTGASDQSSHGSLPAESVIPFVLTEANNLSVPATIDRQYPVNLMFHTAVSSLSLTKEATARLSGLKLDKTETVSSWGGKTKVRYGENHSIQVGGRNWDGVTLGESDYSGPATDGKFGPNLFAGKIVAIDFDTSTIKLYDGLPKLDAGFQKLKLSVKEDLMFVEGTVRIGEKDYQNQFLIHSGFGGTLLLDDAFVSSNKLAEQLVTVSETALKDSFGNTIKTRNVLVPSVSLGDARLEGVTVGLFDAALGRQKVSVMGGNLLKRFNIVLDVLDIKDAHIYLKPNQHFGDPFAKKA
jgi:hypothetical protein